MFDPSGPCRSRSPVRRRRARRACNLMQWIPRTPSPRLKSSATLAPHVNRGRSDKKEGVVQFDKAGKAGKVGAHAADRPLPRVRCRSTST